MKILKIFGIVAGIHLFALVVIFANPGCSSTTKQIPQPGDTAAPPITAAPTTAESTSSGYFTSGGKEAAGTSTVTFNPDAPATAAPDVRFSPTRPGTPVAGTLTKEPVGDVTRVSTYTVQSGDSLSVIARKHDLTIAQIAAANKLTSKSILKPGQKLLIPAKSGALTAAPRSKSAGSDKMADLTPSVSGATGAMTHVVKPGESLGVIARKYGVKAGDLAVANQISDPAKIRAGMELKIPGWQATGDKKVVAEKKATNGKSTAAAAARTPQPSPAPTSADAAPFIEETAAPAPVPVIRIDEGPITPAP